ncbi:MAG TPA: D-glycero-beta-D-manno-heptose 1-phosphate adenylyltransferase [Fimbriimonas sp.]|nr:D-glycero-beta-D-manno-heptose 1-phosphate adenylyltransferase [Fimbriimonas sp.]
MTIEEATRLRQGKRLVFTNGVFDVLHAGHVRYLQQASELGDLLIVGINSDGSARKLAKGPGRPINTLEDRMEVLEALRVVDGVVPFDESTPEGLIEQLRPEVHVKGGDYTEDRLPEAKIVRSYGGEVVILPTLEGRSSTRVIRSLGLE